MQRRYFITLLGGTATAPLVARAQQKPMPVIGFLTARAAADTKNERAALHNGLAAGGYVEGQNVAIEYRWAEFQYNRLPELAAELVNRQVAVIVATGGVVSPRAAKAATTTIPIVFVTGDDPVKSGLVSSLNRPGGNVTGVTPFASELGPKRLEFLHEMVPTAGVIGMLMNPTFADVEVQSREAREAARTLGLQLHILYAASESDFDSAFSTFSKLKIGALFVGNDGLFLARREKLVALAARHAIAAIYPWRDYVASGGLMSYAPSLTDAYHQAGICTAKILDGASPADLPVIQPTRFELVVNLKTAKALGLAVPPLILARADEVIE